MTDAKSPSSDRFIAFQGEPGAYSELACQQFMPDFTPHPYATFEKAIRAVTQGHAERAMLPVENSLAGRVSDIHVLLPESDLHIIGEYFLPIHHQLMACAGVKFEALKTIRSHAMSTRQKIMA
jgi:prephenate dehydratase